MESVSLLLKVLWAPGEAMSLLSKKPRVIVPLLLLCLTSLATTAVVFTKIDPGEIAIRSIERSAQSQNMPDELKERIRAQARSPIPMAIGFVFSAIGPALMIAIISAVYFGVFTMFGREGGYKAFYSVTAFAFVPQVFRQAASIIQVFVVPQSAIVPDELGSISPAVFLDRDSMSRVLFAAVNMIDLVTIWILALLVIGFGFLMRKGVSTALRGGVVAGMFLVYAAFRLGLAYLRGF